jgi:alkyl hydroperoxide reductase subunit D
MTALERVAASIPEAAKDLRLNVQTVLRDSSLSPAQRWGVAVASAIAARNPRLRDAVLADAATQVEPSVVEDATAAAALMGMNNVYYRFRHVVGDPVYQQQPARLRMHRLARPATSRVDLELFSLAVSAINGCEACVRGHERTVREGGLSEAQVNDAVRIAAAIHGAAVALEAQAGTGAAEAGAA